MTIEFCIFAAHKKYTNYHRQLDISTEGSKHRTLLSWAQASLGTPLWGYLFRQTYASLSIKRLPEIGIQSSSKFHGNCKIEIFRVKSGAFTILGNLNVKDDTLKKGTIPKNRSDYFRCLLWDANKEWPHQLRPNDETAVWPDWVILEVLGHNFSQKIAHIFVDILVSF